jgi:MobA/MobL family
VHDERTGQTYSFAHREAPTHCEALLPGGAPRGLATVASLANAMELSENRKNSQTAREFVLALPADREVSHGDRCRDAARFRAGAFHLKGPRGDCFNPSGALRRPAEAAGL